MLLQLEVLNVALIDKLCVEFSDGLNVLSGETGAGKSIIIDSIKAVLGERIPREVIRTGQDSASVTAVFIINNAGLNAVLTGAGITPEEDGTLVVYREFNTQGRNICRVNGKMVTVTFLKEISTFLIDIHGQHDNQSLLKVEKHIELLDSFCGEEFSKVKQDYTASLNTYRELVSKLNRLFGNESERERRADLLRFQTNEIKDARLKANEDRELTARRNLLQSAEKISVALNNAYEQLYAGSSGEVKNIFQSAYDSVVSAGKDLMNISKIDERFDKLLSRVDEIGYLLEDVSGDIKNELDEIEFDPKEIEKIEERLDVIFKLKRKYGNSIDDILAYYEKASRELAELENSRELAEKAEKEIANLRLQLGKYAAGMTGLRKNAAQNLEKGIVAHIKDLEMKNAVFKVEFETLDDFSENGLDKIEFLVSANAGEPVKPLSKIASGGEMSRIMLAIKTILADVDNVPTLIFDEIDTGISGVAAKKVAEKMIRISENHQIISVTHLAQIAAAADHNLLIQKNTVNNVTSTSVSKLSGDDLVNEIARILDGNQMSSITRAHAEEMLRNAKLQNNQL